jgi:hypothetical protein
MRGFDESMRRDARAGVCEGQRYAFADAAIRAGDQHRFAAQLHRHVCRPCATALA